MADSKLISCLLVTTDPDDQFEFTEALNEITDGAVLLSIADGERALYFLQAEEWKPDYIFLDAFEYGDLVDAFRGIIGPQSSTTLMFYKSNEETPSVLISGDYTYLKLKDRLGEVLNPS